MKAVITWGSCTGYTEDVAKRPADGYEFCESRALDATGSTS